MDTANVYSYGSSAEVVGRALKRFSRREDIYHIHRFDSETPIEETMEALHDVVKPGKARYISASSM